RTYAALTYYDYRITITVTVPDDYEGADAPLLIRRRLQFLDLLDQVGLLVVELFILGAIGVKSGQEVDQFLPITQQYVEDRLRFVRVRHEHLEDVERFELDVARLLLQHVHHQLQIIRIGDVLRHDREVVAIEQQLAQQLQALSPRHVVLRVQQLLVVVEHLVVVLLEKLRAQDLVAGKQLPERRKCIRRDIERRHLDVAEEVKELVRVQHDLGQRLVPGALAHHRATVQRYLLVLVASHQCEQDLRFCANVLHRRRAGADLSSEDIVEDLGHILLALEVDAVQVLN
uniref:Uncharacterized protein n=1 Tax=Anopheles atroparvus TaxID=41427 RepID=A0AAG5CUF7_ANOAO